MCEVYAGPCLGERGYFLYKRVRVSGTYMVGVMVRQCGGGVKCSAVVGGETGTVALRLVEYGVARREPTVLMGGWEEG